MHGAHSLRVFNSFNPQGYLRGGDNDYPDFMGEANCGPEWHS